MRLRCLLLCAALLCSSTRSFAQEASPAPAAEDRTEEAKGLFAAGRASFDAGRYQDALDYFERSYAISKKPGLLYNIALAHDRLRNDEKALAGYEAYLAAVPEAPNRADVETRAAAIRAALARREPAPPSAQVPAPAEVAAGAEPPPAATTPAPAESYDAAEEPTAGGSVLTKWWFWTAVGVVVAGGATAVAIAASGGEDDPAPLAPRSGVVVTTLRVTR